MASKQTKLEDIFPFMKTTESVGEKPSETKVRQNFHQDSETGINTQINLELYASQTYRSMATYFDRDDVALSGFAAFFRKSAEEETGHAEKLMRYQNKRGGRVIHQDVKRPSVNSWGSGLEAMTAALELEKNVNQALLNLHKVALKHDDGQMASFLQDDFLGEQVESIKQISDYVTNLKRVGPGMGEFIFDKHGLSSN